MFIIGITGGTGAGKTTALKALSSLGSLLLDGDEIYHELLAGNPDLKAEIEARWSGVMVAGEIDRKRLGKIVFSSSSELLELNAITHRYVDAEIEKRITAWEAQGGKLAAIDAIALIESGLAKKCSVVVGVTAPFEFRVARIMRRDRITREQAEMRIRAQKPAKYYEDNCDHMLDGIYDSPAEFGEKCREFFTELLTRA